VEGVPRGAVLSHTNLISANLQVIASMGLSSRDVHLAMLPLFHITGMNLALAVMQLGGKNVVMEKFNEQETLALTLKEGVSIWGSFPPILNRMTDEIKKQDKHPATLKYVVGLDGPDNIKDFEKLTASRFWILYGQCETSGFVTFSPASDKPGTAGKQSPLSNYILVDENDSEVPAGETGEIVVRGPLVFQGYWRQDALNARTFRNGWHHTGDFGQLDSEGYLLYKGRKPEKELIKPGGENVYPAEVEAVIMQHPDLEAVSVIGVSDAKFGEGVKAVCVRRTGSALTAKELIEFVGSRIARYKKPGYVEFVEELPMDGNTINRNKVKELYGR
jgi:long-chain acyl-CoA synthetase